MHTRLSKRSGFSLIELLVVIAIIAIVSGLMFVGVQKAKEAQRRAKAKVQVKQLEKAFTAYFDEYGEWPRGMTSYDGGDEDSLIGIEVEEKCALMFAAEGDDDMLDKHNPQRIRFLPGTEGIGMSKDGSHSKRGFLDPWGHCYKYMMDINDDGTIKIKYTQQAGQGDEESVDGYNVVIWSRGADGMDGVDDDGRSDDITSWKKR